MGDRKKCRFLGKNTFYYQASTASRLQRYRIQNAVNALRLVAVGTTSKDCNVIRNLAEDLDLFCTGETIL